MKIWLHSATALETDPAFEPYRKALIKHSQKVARTGTQVDVHGGIEVMSAMMDRARYIQSLNIPNIVDNALQAEKEGCDAFVLTCMYDPGFYDLREVLSIPVVFPLETCCTLACLLAPKFTLLGHSDIHLRRLTDMVKNYGLSERYVLCPSFNISLQAMNAGFTDPEPVLKELRPIVKVAAQQGADMLISTSGNLNMILVTHGIKEIEGIPFMDSVGAGIKAAELLVDLKNIGIERARRGLFTPLSKEQLAHVRRIYCPK